LAGDLLYLGAFLAAFSVILFATTAKEVLTEDDEQNEQCANIEAKQTAVKQHKKQYDNP